MTPEEARQTVIDMSWYFLSEAGADNVERPQVLYKYFCFDAVFQMVIAELKGALEIVVAQKGDDELLPQKAFLMKSLIEVRPMLSKADGRVRPNEQIDRDRSILLLDETLAALYYKGGMAKYYETYFDPSLLQNS